MKIRELQQAILLCRDAVVTPFIWGHRGLGKSAITSQTATQYDMGFSDMRLSQCEASDLRGLPFADKVKNKTEFLPPADLPVGGITWEAYMKKMDLPGVLKEHVDQKELAEMLNMDPNLIKDPKAVVTILTKLGKFREADVVARMQAEMTPQLDRGILFLDELNRAQDDVLQAVFQLVLDRQIGTYVVPSGWQIVCAGNYMEGYMTNGFTDPAFLDRFVHLTLDGGETTLEEWVDYMSKKYSGDAADIIEFASQNTKHLDGDIKGEHGFSVQPSRRSWESVIRVDRAFDEAGGKYSEDARLGVMSGLVGREAALSYTRYNCPVRPRDLISKGVEHYKKKLAGLNRNQRTGLCWGLVSFLKGKMDKEKEAKVATDFARFLVTDGHDSDIAVAFCNLMIGGNNLKTRAAMVSNPAVAKLIGNFRGKTSKKTFVDRLNQDPILQKLVSKTAWGSGE